MHEASTGIATQPQPPHVLIVEDDPEVAAITAHYLRGQGLGVRAVGDGSALFDALAHSQVDVVLLDLGLPGEDGLTILRELRTRWKGPVIIVSGRGEPVERVVGLELGADDYVAKPFDFRELLARIRSVLRRAERQGDAQPAANAFRFAAMTLDCDARRLVRDDGTEIALSSGEFDLLSALSGKPGHVFTRDALMNRLHGHDAGPFDRAIDVQIGRLRRKLGDDSEHPRIIKSVRGTGYVFAARVERGA